MGRSGGDGQAWARVRRVARPVAGAALIGVLLAEVGIDPFLDGLRRTGSAPLAAALALTALTTLACAWRWSLVARRLGVDVPVGTAVAACYRSQFLNATLPGGVLGDAHRAVRHGRDAGHLGRGVRSVVWERCAGQAVQVSLTLLVLLLLPSPVRRHAVLLAVLLAVLVVVLAAAVALGPVVGAWPATTPSPLRRTAAELRHVLLAREVLPGVVVASTVAVLGHTAVFVVAVHAAGVTVPPDRVLPLAGLVLLGAAVPVNVAGWGPREGVAAWAFAATGAGAEQGVTVAVVYGVMALAATLPGAALLLGRTHGRRRREAAYSHG
ncbi:lysylphosphatidylglycerol synthase domain-containing protein [Nocardioides sp. MAHUQ-72]|uniref:lysylphosphatidylglycerol synthase domain-containing protein n=1 Tax=unclassified Nocardioides TaxID=2615069 RepID=UPI003610E442